MYACRCPRLIQQAEVSVGCFHRPQVPQTDRGLSLTPASTQQAGSSAARVQGNGHTEPQTVSDAVGTRTAAFCPGKQLSRDSPFLPDEMGNTSACT